MGEGRTTGNTSPHKGEEQPARFENPIIAAWRLRLGRRRGKSRRVLLAITYGVASLVLVAYLNDFITMQQGLSALWPVLLWVTAVPLVAGWLLYGLYDGCLLALDMLAPQARRSPQAPLDEMIGLTAITNTEILLSGLRLALVPLIPRALAAAAAIWAALTVTNWVWGLDAYGQYGGFNWLRGQLADDYFDSFYWDIVIRLLVKCLPLILAFALSSLLACAFIILALICAGRHGPSPLLARAISFCFVIAQPFWLLAGICLFYTPELPEGISVLLALVAPAVFAVIAALFWLALINGGSPGLVHVTWAGQLLLTGALVILLAMVVAYGNSWDARYFAIVPANSIWGLSCLAVFNPFCLPPEGYTWLLEDSYYNYGFDLGQALPYLLGHGPWLLMTAAQIGLVAIGLAFAREAVSRWRHGAE